MPVDDILAEAKRKYQARLAQAQLGRVGAQPGKRLGIFDDISGPQATTSTATLPPPAPVTGTELGMRLKPSAPTVAGTAPVRPMVTPTQGFGVAVTERRTPTGLTPLPPPPAPLPEEYGDLRRGDVDPAEQLARATQPPVPTVGERVRGERLISPREVAQPTTPITDPLTSPAAKGIRRGITGFGRGLVGLPSEPAETVPERIGETIGQVLGFVAPLAVAGPVAGGVKGLISRTLGKIAPRVAQTGAANLIARAAGTGALLGGVRAGQEGVKQAFKLEDSTLEDILGRIGQDTLAGFAFGAAGQLVGEPVSLFIARKLPRVLEPGLKGFLSRAATLAGRGAATGTAAMLPLEAVQAIKDPQAFDLEESAGRVLGGALTFALLDVAMGLRPNPPRFRVQFEPGKRAQGGFTTEPGNPAAEGYTEAVPGSGIWGRQAGNRKEVLFDLMLNEQGVIVPKFRQVGREAPRQAPRPAAALPPGEVARPAPPPPVEPAAPRPVTTPPAAAFKVGDLVRIPGRTETYTVIDTRDPSLLVVEGPDGRALRIVADAVEKVEAPAAAPEAPPVPREAQTPTPAPSETFAGTTGARPPAPAAEKEPWKMTRGEWEREREQLLEQAEAWSTGTGGTQRRSFGGARDEGAGERAFWVKHYEDRLHSINAFGKPEGHKEAVESAISEGKTVPPEVLADYPDLQKQVKEPAPARPAAAEETPVPLPEKAEGVSPGAPAVVPPEAGAAVPKSAVEGVKAAKGDDTLPEGYKVTGKTPGFTKQQQLYLATALLEERAKITDKALGEEGVVEPLSQKEIDRLRRTKQAAPKVSSAEIAKATEKGETVVIRVPGDGTFVIFRNPRAIDTVLKALKVQEVETKEGGEKLPSAWTRFLAGGRELVILKAEDGGVWITNAEILERVPEKPLLTAALRGKTRERSDLTPETTAVMQAAEVATIDIGKGAFLPPQGEGSTKHDLRAFSLPDGSILAIKEDYAQYAEKRGYSFRATEPTERFGRVVALYKGKQLRGIVLPMQIENEKVIERARAALGLSAGTKEEQPTAQERARQRVDEAATEREKRGTAGAIRIGRDQEEPQKGSSFASEDENVEERWQAAAEPIPGPTPWETLQENLKELQHFATRTYQNLPQTPQYAELRAILNRYQKAKGISTDKAARLIQGVTLKMNKGQKEIFERAVVLSDLVEDVGLQRERGVEEPKVAFYDDKVDVLERDHKRVMELADADPEVGKALQLRKELLQEITDALVNITEKVTGHRPQLNRRDYFHHMVLVHMQERRARADRRPGGGVKAPTSAGYLKKRTVNALDISHNYVQSELEVMSQMLQHTMTYELLDYVGNKFNIIEALKHEAVRMNEARIMPLFQAMADAENARRAAEAALSRGSGGEPVTAEDMFRRTLNVKQAMGFEELGKMAAKGQLPLGEGGEWEALIDALAENYETNRAIKQDLGSDYKASEHLVGLPDWAHDQLFKYLSWLLKEKGGEPGSGAAATIFKGTREKREFIKQNLGDRFVTWEDIIPEGYTTFQPQPGNVVFMAWTLPEQYIQRMMDESFENLELDPEKLQQMMVLGGKRRQWVVPEEINDTLNALGRRPQRNVISRASRGIIGAWKQYVLLAPHGGVTYNLNNLSGDADAVAIGNPAAFKRALRATKDLYHFLIRRGAPSKELEKWLDQGGLHDVLQAAEQVGNVQGLKLFWSFLEQQQKKSGLAALAELPAKAWSGYWKGVRRWTDMREAILRYANFLEYREQIRSNPKGEPKNWGASIPEEVMAIKDLDARAYKLSNELLGAYDDVPEAAKYVAEFWYPFWRWQSVNFRRYKQLLANARRDVKGTTLLGRRVAAKVTGTIIRSPVIAMRIGLWVLFAHWLVGLTAAYNHLLWRDEEADLPAQARTRPHIIVGRDERGRVQYITTPGALSDLLAWVGLDQSRKHIEDLLAGRATMKEIVAEMAKASANKAWQGIGPIKSFFESALGQETFPDVFDRYPVRDRMSQFLKNYGLRGLYDAAVGRPVEPGATSVGIKRILGVKVAPLPDQVAYSEIRDLKSRWLRERGRNSEGRISPRSNALYWLKLAARYGDEEAVRKYLLEYAELGGTLKGLEASFAALDPLYGIAKKDRQAFVNALSPSDRQRLDAAYRFYREALLGPKQVELIEKSLRENKRELDERARRAKAAAD